MGLGGYRASGGPLVWPKVRVVYLDFRLSIVSIQLPAKRTNPKVFGSLQRHELSLVFDFDANRQP